MRFSWSARVLGHRDAQICQAMAQKKIRSSPLIVRLWFRCFLLQFIRKRKQKDTHKKCKDTSVTKRDVLNLGSFCGPCVTCSFYAWLLLIHHSCAVL